MNKISFVFFSLVALNSVSCARYYNSSSANSISSGANSNEFCASICSTPTAQLYHGGTGVDSDPYIISTPAELNAVRCNPDKSFKLSNNIDLSGGINGEQMLPLTDDFDIAYLLSLFSSSQPFPPPLTACKQFSGSFDGNHFAIQNWTFSSNSFIAPTLFPLILFANIHDLTISNPTITSSDNALFATSLSGVSITTTYNNIRLDGTVNIQNNSPGGGAACGLIANSTGDYITNITADFASGSQLIVSPGGNSQDNGDNVSGVLCDTGGIGPVAQFDNVSVNMTDTTFAIGNSSTIAFIGGVVGRAFSGSSLSNLTMTATNSHFTGPSSAGVSSIGGIIGGFGHVGMDDGTTLTGTNTATLTGTTFSGGINSQIGGFVGYTFGDSGDIISNGTINLNSSFLFGSNIPTSNSDVGYFGGNSNTTNGNGSAVTISGITESVTGTTTLTGHNVNSLTIGGGHFGY